MEVTIDNNIYKEALFYAQNKGVSIKSEIEDFLIYFINTSKKKENKEVERNIPEPVLALLGAATPRMDDDPNARDAYYSHLMEKYK